jgi:hypothetical protein
MPLQVSGVRFIRHQKAEATIIRACPNCNAPGIYTSRPDVKAHWPGCWISGGDDKENQPVGEVCPNCSELRTRDEPLGVIWDNWIFGSHFQKWSHILRSRVRSVFKCKS